VWNKLKLYTTKTLLPTIFSTNDFIYYFRHRNCSNPGNPHTHALGLPNNLVPNNICRSLNKRSHLWMIWGVTKLKSLILMTLTSVTIIILTTAAWTILASNNPINLRLVIVVISIILTVMIRINISSWYAIILFLIYVGGIIVIFSYFVRLTSNDSIILKRNIHFILIPLICIKINSPQEPVTVFTISQISTIYLPKNIIILLLITLILLIIIVIVIKIVKIDNGPLRGFNQCI